MLEYKSFNSSHFYRRNINAPRKRYRVKPKFAFTISGIDMDVCGFFTLVGIEMESIGSYSRDCRHLRTAGP